ncbi:cation diffusion facilitator family transporter [Heliophilum fasciatum]|uniref:Cation diffusion facilitator family transporter n=1 Tax=Heliophilum fasciatum TaxID=35700 RepID=A0A4V2SY73_9FIRM|nr:cation diffusion facilitator family transporter [Heliophilum fasciatum]MCW2276663.1 cation diffusion facilitator family transporter [Heliophilum fasciatum]TCP68956.1 cation diffusion facilitator family transporter [Heliophilum fasciatum]
MLIHGDAPWYQRGNQSAKSAFLGNVMLSMVKYGAAVMSGSGAMFAEAIHTVADAANQGLVWFGSIFAEHEPTDKYPHGFGRLVNLLCLLAAAFIVFMSTKTVLHGYELLMHPEAEGNFLIAIAALLLSIGVDGKVWLGAMREVAEESGSGHVGLVQLPFVALANLHLASPPTKLVFWEDFIAVGGALLALVAVVIGHFSHIAWIDPVVTMIIGAVLVLIALKIGWENALALIGVAAPESLRDKVAKVIISNANVADIRNLYLLAEGDKTVVACEMEWKSTLPFRKVDAAKEALRAEIMAIDSDIIKIILDGVEDDKIPHWKGTSDGE